MTIQHIYDHYRILPSLQLHQYRVAAVAKVVAESMSSPLDLPEILTATLLHDMGNILKFEFDRFPDFLQPEGKEYWQCVQDQYRQKYGDDEHDATTEIARELHISPRSFELLDAIGFHTVIENVAVADFAKKIVEYADARVAPRGVTSLQERLHDLEERYKKRYPSLEDHRRRQEFQKLAVLLEEQIFAHSSLKPADITEASIQSHLENLRNFEIMQ